MRQWYVILLALPLLLGCVGQKEDPEELPQPGPEVPEGQEPGASEGTRAFHRILALEFTATWCQYCPRMAAALEDASAARPGRIVDIAVHQYDEVSPAEADAIVTLFKASGFPKMAFDWDTGTLSGETASQWMIDYVDAEVIAPTCNIALETLFSEGKLQAKVSVKAHEEASYSVAAALVQDRIVLDQVGYGPGFNCMSVLRAFLGAGMDGEALGKLGRDEEKSFSFTGEMDLGSFPEADFRVVAFVRKDGRVVNALTGPLNGKTNYRYEKEDF